MKLSHKENLTWQMRTRKMPRPAIVCRSAQSAEVEDLAADYADFCEHLTDLNIDEIVPLSEFAIWRSQELEDQDWTNPVPSIH